MDREISGGLKEVGQKKPKTKRSCFLFLKKKKVGSSLSFFFTRKQGGTDGQQKLQTKKLRPSLLGISHPELLNLLSSSCEYLTCYIVCNGKVTAAWTPCNVRSMRFVPLMVIGLEEKNFLLKIMTDVKCDQNGGITIHKPVCIQKF